VTLQDIAGLLGAELDAPGKTGNPEIRRVAKIEEAQEGDITFLANPKYTPFLSTTAATAVLVGRSTPAPSGPNRPVLLRVDDPYLSFLRVMVTLNPPKDPLPPGVHPSAVIHPSAELGNDVRVGANVVIDEHCRIGDRTTIGHGCVLGSGVTVGNDTVMYANVTVREGCRIGTRVILQPGAVIGSDGFGFAPAPDGSFKKIPQLGIVIIEDDVEVGANTTIDRATMGETVIKRGVKLDNLIQVAHNVVIGENTVIAAQTGISGSTRIGRNCMIAGQVGFTGHIEIADGTKIGAQSGVHRSIQETGTSILGYPALPQREAVRAMAALGRLPDALAELRELRNRLNRLEGTPEADPPAGDR
jgi:UDP-3-O-[3-hydroxymyristoyl] glucosamine N-acyltransferase